MRRVAGVLTAALLLAGVPVGADAAGGSTPGGPAARDVRPPPVVPLVHRVHVAYPTNRGDFDGAALDKLVPALDAVLREWRAQQPDAFLALEPAGPPVGYAASVMPPTSAGCGLDWNDQTGFDPTMAEVRARLGVVPTPGVVDHVLLVLPWDCFWGGAAPRQEQPMGWNGGGAAGFFLVPNQGTEDLQAKFRRAMGYTFGLGDADIDCLSRPCMHWAYGDCWSPMGLGSGSLSSAHRTAAGLLRPGETVVLDADESGPIDTVVQLRPRGEGSGLRGIEVVDPHSGSTHYLDYRAPVGLDSAQGRCPSGITITHRMFPRVNYPWFLHNPTSTDLYPRSPVTTPSMAELAWRPGDVAHLAEVVRVEVLSTDPVEGARVRVVVPGVLRIKRARLRGSFRVGERVRVVVRRDRDPHEVRLHYVWQVGGKRLRKHDERGLVLTPAMAGKRIRVVVTARAPRYVPGQVQTQRTPPIRP